MSRSKATSITLPGELMADVDQWFVEPIATERFFGRASRSMVIRALLEIAVENGARFDRTKPHNYEGLKLELARILKDHTES
ncbi:hypothetical protein ALQ01_200008 [Pseudomonas savastanoi pv. glycinea]|uniref:Stability/partitioning determinant n=1 Tax=Pseudomonas savastanoi pv. glycinea TaxID=318 RepID=A0A3M4MWS6_PSESG|nr:hypothetical protein ALQ73_200301 [Pseudomonas savastanoi pv. glycinea]RMQ58149.1 hypothetical protein ALQ01_200008 [Pseudomonas savastanoi pv. glycinea]